MIAQNNTRNLSIANSSRSHHIKVFLVEYHSRNNCSHMTFVRCNLLCKLRVLYFKPPLQNRGCTQWHCPYVCSFFCSFVRSFVRLSPAVRTTAGGGGLSCGPIWPQWLINDKTVHSMKWPSKVTQGHWQSHTSIGRISLSIGGLHSNRVQSILHRFWDIQHIIMACPWNLSWRPFKVIENDTIRRMQVG